MNINKGTRNVAVVLGTLGLAWWLYTREPKLPRQDDRAGEASIPSEIQVPASEGGFCFGKVPSSNNQEDQRQPSAEFYGKPMNMDGNILVIGGPGSGKTTGHVYPTMETWKGSASILFR